MFAEKDLIIFPVNKIDNVTLETKVNELDLTPSKDLRCYVGVPPPLHSCQMRNLFYLAGDVNALTTKIYLESVNPETALAALFTMRGDFYPFGSNEIPTLLEKVI